MNDFCKQYESKKKLYIQKERELSKLKRIPLAQDPEIKQKIRKKAGEITRLDHELQKLKKEFCRSV